MKIKQREPAGRSYKQWVYKDVQLTGIDLFYPNVLLKTNDELIFPICETTMSLQVGSVYECMNMEISLPDAPVLREETSPVFYFIYNTDNYFHFLYDALPILSQYSSSMKLLINPKHKYPYIEDCLRLLGIPQSQWVYADPNTLYHTLHVGSSPTHEGCPNEPPRSDIWQVYDRMKREAYKHPIETPLKFYVSRRSWIHGDTTNIGTNYTTRRKLMIEDELVEELKKKGYQEVFCELLTMAEKIQYFANATHIVGAIGGGLCNLVFAQSECRVLSLNSPEFDTINARFLFTMYHTNLTQYRDTYAVSNLYRRVRLPDGFGELVREDGDRIWVRSNKGVTFQQDDELPIVELTGPINYLDNGLNSPWSFDLKDFMRNT